MTFIPNDDEDWEEWKSMALRLYAALGNEGFALFDAWSLLSIKYDAERTLRSLGASAKLAADPHGGGEDFQDGARARVGAQG